MIILIKLRELGLVELILETVKYGDRRASAPINPGRVIWRDDDGKILKILHK